MKFPESWLRSFVDPKMPTQELAHVLTMGGLDVESVEPVAPAFDKVVIGQVLQAAKHPNADRLTLCRVDTGGDAPLSIVCGAPNVVVGMKAPVALLGARLPGMEIKQAKVRGVESSGMLCSAKDLGLSQDHSGLLVLPADARPGADVRRVLDLDDQLITLKLTPNRGDCLSLRGIAREVAILTATPLIVPAVTPAKAALHEKREILLQDTAACPRYCGRIIRAVNVRARTPDWMVRRLERCGMRSISAIVDITNFVMLELGQPLHAFDNRAIKGEVIVRRARQGERLRLLNGQDIELTPDVLLIADTEKPLALGGVMGGEASAVSDSTAEVFLEAAWFDPSAVAGRARRFALSSDAAFRFERGVDFAATPEAIERATQLIFDICGGAAGPISEVAAALPQRNPVRLRSSRVSKIVGVQFSDEQIAGLLKRLQLPHTRSAGEFAITPPSYRFDLDIEEDMVEEIARLHGYDNIPCRPPRAALAMLAAPEGRRPLSELKRILVDREYFEVVNFSFVEAQWESDFCGNTEPIALENPIAAQLDVMRSSLMGSLVANLRFNLARKVDRVRVFEAARCFSRSSSDEDPRDPARALAGYHQPLRLGGLAYGPAVAEQWGMKPTREVDFYDVRGDVEALLAPRGARFAPLAHPGLHPGRAASIILSGAAIGWLGELHPRWQRKYDVPRAPVLFELDVDGLAAVDVPQYREISKFPAVIRDRSMEFDEGTPVSGILEELTRNRPPLVQDIRLFDFYRGKGVERGKKSLAFRVVMQDTARTLTDAEADAAMAQLTELLAAKFGAKLRS
ncbi:MAG: phenylalanine--tRNA ligase subunit beta [Betaproteobacteria bacterium]|nr:MAG: phenylalanine--tRNA ligase subunit beta [Betaproteobacteria bacterium]TMH92211.1 MAG: phenylalanine--tRNA ligase subunit beta [Betaproteobacteria bacterium]